MNFKCCKINDLNLENKEFVSSSIKCPEKEGGKMILFLHDSMTKFHCN